MAVLWRSNENTSDPDARYREDNDPSPAVAGVAGQKNTFLEKHLRICDPLPSEEDMKKIVKKVYDDRQRSKSSRVQSVTGPSDKTKQQLYGGIKPPANSTYFIGLAGFQETNAWIEKNVSASNKHAEVPILGDGVVVTYDNSTMTYAITKAGKIRLSVAVGNSTDFEGSQGQALSIQSKIVYHWGGTV
jgi:cytochrome oxidase Cu insertion factor (SCO1/SenC/PrrC family)